MKKSLAIGFLSIAFQATSMFGQGVILLDNYNTSGPLVTYGSAGVPLNGGSFSGPTGTVGTGLQAGWTLGLYYAVGNVTVSPDPTPWNISDPSTLGGLTFATGSGSTAAFYSSTANTPGEALATMVFAVPGTAIGGGDTITLEAVAYNGPVMGLQQ